MQRALSDSSIVNHIPLGVSAELTDVYVMVLLTIWLLFLIVYFVVLLKKYTWSANWTKDHSNPYQRETLGLPRGSIRTLLILGLLGPFIIVETLGYQIEGLRVSFQMALAFYFGSKVLHHVAALDNTKTRVIAEALKVGFEEAMVNLKTRQRTRQDEHEVG